MSRAPNPRNVVRSAPVAFPGRAGAARGKVLTSGLIAWAVVLALPIGVAAPRAAAWPSLVALLAPLALASLLWRHEVLRRGLLVIGHPVALALGVALSPQLAALDAYPPTMRLLAALAFLAYGAAASVADAGDEPAGIAVEWLSAVGGDPALARRSRWRAVWLGAGTLAALLLTVVVPALGPDARSGFGAEAAAAAETLVAVIAAALGVVVVAGFVGPATRRRRTRLGRRWFRVALYLMVAAVGVLVLRAIALRS